MATYRGHWRHSMPKEDRTGFVQSGRMIMQQLLRPLLGEPPHRPSRVRCDKPSVLPDRWSISGSVQKALRRVEAISSAAQERGCPGSVSHRRTACGVDPHQAAKASWIMPARARAARISSVVADFRARNQTNVSGSCMPCLKCASASPPNIALSLMKVFSFEIR